MMASSLGFLLPYLSQTWSWKSQHLEMPMSTDTHKKNPQQKTNLLSWRNLENNHFTQAEHHGRDSGPTPTCASVVIRPLQCYNEVAQHPCLGGIRKCQLRSQAGSKVPPPWGFRGNTWGAWTSIPPDTKNAPSPQLSMAAECKFGLCLCLSVVQPLPLTEWYQRKPAKIDLNKTQNLIMWKCPGFNKKSSFIPKTRKISKQMKKSQQMPTLRWHIH